MRKVKGYRSEHWKDANGNPAGGCSYGRGFTISWQNGPLTKDGQKIPANGAFVEDVIAAIGDRIGHMQSTRYRNEHNEKALEHLRKAYASLQEGRKARNFNYNNKRKAA